MWPDNWPAVEFFAALGNGCWQTGNAGPVGLRYESFAEVRFALGIADADWRAMFHDVRVMEGAALKAMREQQKAPT